MAAKKQVVCPAVQPNAGVEAWYRQRLQTIVTQMAESMLYHARAAYKAADLGIGFAQDATTERAAGVMFRLPDGRVLLCRRTDGEGWAFPGGGLELNEEPEGAARREASEEIGWSGGEPLPLWEVSVTRNLCFSTFLCDVSAPFPMFLNGEHDRAEWTTPEYALRFHHLHPGVRSTLERFVPELALDAKPRGNPSVLLRKALEKWGAIWRGRLDDLSLDLASKFADKNFKATQTAMLASFKQAGFTVEFKPTAAVRTAYEAVVAENVNLIKSIPQQYLKDVQSQVWSAVMKGSDLATLSKGLQEKYGIAYRRAALIARDQNAKAKAVIENTRRKQLGITQGIWQHSHAGKVPRPTHVAMNGKVYELEQGMWDKDEREYVWPGTLINCRCTSRAVIPGFEETAAQEREGAERARKLNERVQAEWRARYGKKS